MIDEVIACIVNFLLGYVDWFSEWLHFPLIDILAGDWTDWVID